MKNVDATVFPSIEHLQLESLPELQEICDGPISSTSFQNLKELQLTDLSALREFWKSSSVCQSNNVPHFSNLSSIDISKCDSLRNLGQLSMAGKECLPQLEELHINSCSMMEQVFLWNHEERHLITKVFPKLKEVKLRHLRNLTTFYQGIEGIEFPLLWKLIIYECPKMKSIIMASNEKSNSGEITSSTADQHIDDDDASLHLFCQSGKVSFSSSFKVLEMNHNPFCGHEIPSWLFNGLEKLTINKYEGSMSLFTLSMASNLVSLRKLLIRNCDEMIKVIEDKEQQGRILVFPKLKELELNNLPKLVSFCDSKCEVELPLLRDVKLRRLPKLVSFCDSKCEVELPLLRTVEIERCPNMENFSMGLVATPNLEGFRTDLTTYVGVGDDDVAFDSLKKLEISYNENPFVDRKISVSLFNRLEKLKFSWYKGGSMSLFSSSAVGNLVNLKQLRIVECDEMLVKVIQDQEEDEKVMSGGEIITSVVIFPKLEELYLWSLPKLVRFCEWKCDVELPSLRKVVIVNCPNMESFSMGCVAAPNLKFVEKDGRHKEIDATEDLNGAMRQLYLARQQKEEVEVEDRTEDQRQKLVLVL